MAGGLLVLLWKGCTFYNGWKQGIKDDYRKEIVAADKKALTKRKKSATKVLKRDRYIIDRIDKEDDETETEWRKRMINNLKDVGSDAKSW